MILLVFTLLLWACAVGSAPGATTHASVGQGDLGLGDLQGPAQLREMFNADCDLPRLILLLSPS